MEDSLYIIKSRQCSPILEAMLENLTACWAKKIIIDHENSIDLKNKKIVFAVELDELGNEEDINKSILQIKHKNANGFENATAALLVHSEEELYTKTYAQRLVFVCNQMGMALMGRPLVEATGSLRNFITMQKNTSLTLEQVACEQARKLGESLQQYTYKKVRPENILAIHASDHTSNTRMLWNLIKEHLPEHQVKEIHVENGAIKDCKGCTYKVCKHYGKQSSCFYGGIMVEEIYPRILEADTLVFLCPNYNDAIGANITAVINRLTALFRQTKFYHKRIYALIVSGNSGSDALAKQLISALNMNKTFQLPPRFCMMEIANDSGDIYKVKDIEAKAEAFAKNILN